MMVAASKAHHLVQANAGGHHQAEQPEVNRISHNGVRSFCCQFMALNHTSFAANYVDELGHCVFSLLLPFGPP